MHHHSPAVALSLSLPLLSLFGATAHADAVESASAVSASASAPASPYAFGVRVGGYGFRELEGDRRNGWEDCRMNGLGAFGERQLSEHAFVEGGADLYFAESFPMAPEGESAMDRISGLFTVAGGLRMFPGSRVSSYVQVGTGLELTQVRMDIGGHVHSGRFALPVGFVGAGGDLGIGQRLRLGMNLRAYVMGHFDHDLDAATAAALEPTADLEARPEVAAQAQFYVRYHL